MNTVIYLLLFFGVSFAAALLAAILVWAVRKPAAEGEPEGSAGLLREDGISSIALWARVLNRISHVELLKQQLVEADLKWSAGRMTLLMMLSGALGTALLLNTPDLPLALAPVGFLIGATAPYGYILHRRAKRFDIFARQLPEAFDSMSRALQAGFPLAVCIESLVQEQPEPLASELKRVRDEWRHGLGWEHAMEGLSERIPIPEVRVFAAAVKMQSRTGGRLNQVLGQLGESIREQAALDGEVKTMSANSRMSGSVLTVLPAGIGLVMFLTNPAYMVDFLRHPTGRLAVVLAVLGNVAAHFLIRRMSRIEV
jgi:tight adherence protein B